MSPASGEAIRSMVLGALLEDQGSTPREVHKRLDLWAPKTIRNVLLDLNAEGRARSEGMGRSRRFYKIAQSKVA
ncbi:MAG: hypothetical protein ACXWML_09835 [Candidatus Binataceae bacterium]